MTSKLPELPELNAILLEIANELDNESLEKMKFLCKDCIPNRVLKTIDTPIKLFGKLIDIGKLEMSNTSYLEGLLECIQRTPLKEKLQNFVNKNVSPAVGNSSKGQEYGLPIKRAIFVGRDTLIEMITEKFTEGQKRMIAVVAPPGFGKSCAAIHVGHSMKEQGYSVIFVSLRQITSCVCMCSYILRTLDPDMSLSKDVIQETKTQLCLQEGPTLLVLDNAEDIQNSDSCLEFQNVIEFLGNHAKNLQILLGTRKHIHTKDFDSDSINLSRLDDQASSKLLVAFVGSTRLEDDEAKSLGIQCAGVPLLIKIAAGLVKNKYKPSKLANNLQETPYDVMNLKGNELMEYLTSSIQVFLDSLTMCQRVSLVQLSCFPAEFTQDIANEIFFEKEVECFSIFTSLYSNALLQLDDQNYSLHPLIQTFCREEQKRMKCQKEGEEAMKKFTLHYLDELEELHRKFVSIQCQAALQQFYCSLMNLKQALKNALTCKDRKMKEKCIDVFNGSINLLGKIMHPSHCLEMYEQLYNTAENMKDKKRMSECLVSLGFRHMCDANHGKFSQEAFDAFNSALSLWRKTVFKTQPYTEPYAHCLSKLGLCYVAKGDVEKGKKLINEAIPIRHRLGDKVLIAASNCDKAIADRMCDKHVQAIEILENKCLPVYKAHLGDHPWVASILNYISESHQVLGCLDKAIEYNKQSLYIREKLLGDHQDTARSYVHLGELFLEQENMEDAYNASRKALSIQEKVLGVHEETMATFQVVADILDKLNMGKEGQEIRERADSVSAEFKKRRSLQKQMSENMNRRANSWSEFPRLNITTCLPILLVLVAIWITWLFAPTFF